MVLQCVYYSGVWLRFVSTASLGATSAGVRGAAVVDEENAGEGGTSGCWKAAAERDQRRQ